MTDLKTTIRTEIARARRTISNANSGLIRDSERDTIQKLVMPMMSAIGWDVLDLAEVREELRSAGGGKADIACFTGGRVVMFAEGEARPTGLQQQLPSRQGRIAHCLIPGAIVSCAASRQCCGSCFACHPVE